MYPVEAASSFLDMTNGTFTNWWNRAKAGAGLVFSMDAWAIHLGAEALYGWADLDFGTTAGPGFVLWPGAGFGFGNSAIEAISTGAAFFYIAQPEGVQMSGIVISMASAASGPWLLGSNVLSYLSWHSAATKLGAIDSLGQFSGVGLFTTASGASVQAGSLTGLITSIGSIYGITLISAASYQNVMKFATPIYRTGLLTSATSVTQASVLVAPSANYSGIMPWGISAYYSLGAINALGIYARLNDATNILIWRTTAAASAFLLIPESTIIASCGTQAGKYIEQMWLYASGGTFAGIACFSAGILWGWMF